MKRNMCTCKPIHLPTGALFLLSLSDFFPPMLLLEDLRRKTFFIEELRAFPVALESELGLDFGLREREKKKKYLKVKIHGFLTFPPHLILISISF